MNTDVQNSFRALADPTRRDILMHLSNGEMSIAEVAGRFDITRAAVKKHLTVLEEGALISVHARGRERINRLEPDGIKRIVNWLGYFDKFWDDRLGRLQTVITQSAFKGSKK